MARLAPSFSSARSSYHSISQHVGGPGTHGLYALLCCAVLCAALPSATDTPTMTKARLAVLATDIVSALVLAIVSVASSLYR